MMQVTKIWWDGEKLMAEPIDPAAVYKEPAQQQDIPDLIAGALGVSRGTAYDMMREALAEQPAQQQEPVAYGMWDTMLGKGNRMMMVRLDKGQDGCTVPLQPQRTWVGLTNEKIDQGLLRTNYALKTAEAWRDGVEWAMTQLREKNAP